MSMQGPSNLSNACTSMTAKEQKWKQDGLSKRTPHAHLFWTQNTDLQSNPFRFEASIEATEIIFLISLCTVIWRNKINEIHTWPQEKIQKPNTHHTGIKRSPESCVWQTSCRQEADVTYPFKEYRPHKQKNQNLLEGKSSAAQTSPWRSAPAHAPSFLCLTTSYQKAASFE